MRPTGEARFGVAALLALQLLTSVAGVALLARMAPAVEHILQENVYSTEAVEAMLAAVVTEDDQGYSEALQRAVNNITEQEEEPLLEALRSNGPATFDGDPAARAAVVRDLRTLGTVNRDSMRRADERARLLGLAGAWAMALLGFAGFLVSLVVYRRVEERLILPITEIDDVLASARAGDVRRRCTRTALSPRQDRLAENLNWLLDHRRTPPSSASEDPGLRAVLLELLDQVERPVWLVGPGNRVLAANSAALHAEHSSPWSGPPVPLDGEPPGGDWAVRSIGEVRWVEGPPVEASGPDSPG